MTDRIIETEACIAEGCAWLAEIEPRFAEALHLTGPPPLRRRPGGFGPLLQAICGQQLSVASAGALWSKLCAVGADDPVGLLALSDEDLRACGLSWAKIRYAKALAEAQVDYPSLAAMPEPEAIATLTALKGIGQWTAEIYLLVSVGRADVFAPGDLALQEAARDLFGLDERPSEAALRDRAQAWSPWRGVAARLLWAYYRAIKSREGIV
ncbi:MAG: DNA-3-methyladenine glycosylase 2 family protein [Pseudomonadota bacterium]